jgi:hypothetical protein
VSRMLALQGQSSTSLVHILMIAAGTLCALNLYLVMSTSISEIRIPVTLCLLVPCNAPQCMQLVPMALTPFCLSLANRQMLPQLHRSSKIMDLSTVAVISQSQTLPL